MLISSPHTRLNKRWMNKEEKNDKRDSNTNSLFSSTFTAIEWQLESWHCIHNWKYKDWLEGEDTKKGEGCPLYHIHFNLQLEPFVL